MSVSRRHNAPPHAQSIVHPDRGNGSLLVLHVPVREAAQHLLKPRAAVERHRPTEAKPRHIRAAAAPRRRMLFVAPQLARRVATATLAPRLPSFFSPQLRRAAASVTTRALSAPFTLELEPIVVVVAAVWVAVCLSRPLSAFQAALVRYLNLTAQALLMIASMSYLLAGIGSTLAYEQFLMGMSFSYLLTLSSVVFTFGDE
jgi:hypothetical protein